jgi:hypothetical protein
LLVSNQKEFVGYIRERVAAQVEKVQELGCLSWGSLSSDCLGAFVGKRDQNAKHSGLLQAWRTFLNNRSFCLIILKHLFDW